MSFPTYSLIVSWNVVFRYLFFYATFQTKTTNRNLILRKLFPWRASNLSVFSNCFFPPVPNQSDNLTFTLPGWRMNRNFQKLPMWSLQGDSCPFGGILQFHFQNSAKWGWGLCQKRWIEGNLWKHRLLRVQYWWQEVFLQLLHKNSNQSNF